MASMTRPAANVCLRLPGKANPPATNCPSEVWSSNHLSSRIRLARSFPLPAPARIGSNVVRLDVPVRVKTSQAIYFHHQTAKIEYSGLCIGQSLFNNSGSQDDRGTFNDRHAASVTYEIGVTAVGPTCSRTGFDSTIRLTSTNTPDCYPRHGHKVTFSPCHPATASPCQAFSAKGGMVKTGLSGILNLPQVEDNPRLSGYKVRERSNGWSKIEGGAPLLAERADWGAFFASIGVSHLCPDVGADACPVPCPVPCPNEQLGW